jgi:hypothetical protein
MFRCTQARSRLLQERLEGRRPRPWGLSGDPFYPPVKLRDTAIANQRTDTALADMAKFFLALIAIGFVTLIGAFVFAAFTL